ncbi:ABC transporter substrate-binding protein [Paracraurococcus ruber]|uniref:ABC transporter substrate-binding protein n=1 Tax=Paracraurococcus ruber TaxID=77675 RepID=A0ABS1CUC7_9PROT|nr:ABC transporter substrate-binding protein [Paracraurococcus ruber]MBK1658077.1 ABC transporter substrate-binding protein [Paracraurococcus ruber]TDG34183.1 ABC transporter substrate-binding protein [Paracraurococcus ruber]
MTATRRTLLGASAAMLAMPAFAQPAGRVLRFVPHANLTSLDPIWTSAWVTRNHGYMVYDTLYSMGADLTAKPQMAEGHAVERDGLLWTIILREGLRFHDGEPVLARDAVASLRRWGRRDSFGQSLFEQVEEIAALDDRRLTIRLKRPFPLLLDAIAKVAPCFVMPERIAATDAFTQVTDPVGSGPYRFLRSEWVPGSLAAYARFEGYRPREEAAEMLAGGKRARFDRVEWRVMPDPATAAAALQSGEIDWWENPSNDLLPLLRRNRGVVVEQLEPFGTVSTLRPNHLHPPFSNAAFRRAIWPALSQADIMTAVAGADRANWIDTMGYFTPGTPLASEAGLEAITAPRSLDAAKRAIEASGYRGERLLFMHTTDIHVLDAMSHVVADMFRRLGLNLDHVSTDWGTVVQRRANRAAVEAGGWSAFCTNISGADCLNPATNALFRTNGANAWFGWPDSGAMEAGRAAWFEAGGLPAQQRITAELQRQAFQDVPYYPLGQYKQLSAFRRGLAGLVRAPIPLAWEVAKAG